MTSETQFLNGAHSCLVQPLTSLIRPRRFTIFIDFLSP
jgi:hypothetical protein